YRGSNHPRAARNLRFQTVDSTRWGGFMIVWPRRCCGLRRSPSPPAFSFPSRCSWAACRPPSRWPSASSPSSATRSSRTTWWLRRLLRRELYPYHALIFGESMSWIIFRYLVTIRRIGHYPTLLLEAVFVALFLGLFWGVAALVSRLAEVAFGADADDVFRRVATGALPVILLPIIAIVRVPTPYPVLMVGVA